MKWWKGGWDGLRCQPTPVANAILPSMRLFIIKLPILFGGQFIIIIWRSRYLLARFARKIRRCENLWFVVRLSAWACWFPFNRSHRNGSIKAIFSFRLRKMHKFYSLFHTLVFVRRTRRRRERETWPSNKTHSDFMRMARKWKRVGMMMISWKSLSDLWKRIRLD